MFTKEKIRLICPLWNMDMHHKWLSELIFCGLLHAAFTAAPVITTQSVPANVVENADSQVSLYTLTVSDSDGDPITCSLQATHPNTSDFGIVHNSTDYEVHLLAGSSLDFTSTPVYYVTVECSDGTSTTPMNITVNITPNVPPVFSNLPATSTDVNASAVGLGDVVYNVTATDVDSTSLTYYLTSFPATPALFEIDEVSGKVKATQDLTYAVNSAYDLTITVNDSRDITTSTLIIPLIEINTAPIINNLPSTVYIPETKNSNTGLFDLSISDPDAGDSATVSFIVDPSIYTSKFSVASGNQVRLASGNSFDYEDRTTFTLYFNVSDGKAVTSSNDYVLTVNIVDAIDNCNFPFNYYYITMQEGTANGTWFDPQFTDVAEDAVTFELQNVANASYFNVEPSTGRIRFAIDYDVDVTHPPEPSFRVSCIDADGNAGEWIRLYVTVEDVNDNAPRFNNTGYILYFDQTMTVPYEIGSMIATDADSGDNAVMDYTWSTTGSGSSYFSIYPSGEILLQTLPGNNLDYGTTFRFIVTATDRGSPALSGTTIIDLIYQEVAVPTTLTSNITTTIATTTAGTLPTSDDEAFLDEPGNIGVVVVAILLGLVLCALAAYPVWKYRAKFMPPLKTKTKTIQPKPRPDNTPFDFWNTDKSKNPSNTNKKTGPGGVASTGHTSVFTL